jgi:HSP20 family protein
MITMREAMDRLFDERTGVRTGGSVQSLWALPVDAYVNDDAIVLVADVPGLKPEELDVTLEGDTLTIRGEIKPATEDRKYLLRERAFGKFERVLTINTPIDTNKVEASFENGVVTITLPKAEAIKPKQIQVKANSK